MTEKVIFEFHARNDEKNIVYEISDGKKTHTYTTQKIDRCHPRMFSSWHRIYSEIHRRSFYLYQKRARRTLNTLERMYSDLYSKDKIDRE